MKKLLTFVITAVFLLAWALPAAAEGTPSQKEEVIYGILNADGTVAQLYAVNIFPEGDILDYGSYTAIQNLTDTRSLQQSGDSISLKNSGRFSYQGTLKSKELPWSISIQYLLDGKEISAENLAGQTGKLEIKISVTQNTKADAGFFENYALQIGLTLDTALCENILTENATIALAGSSKQLSFTVLPGEEASLSVQADVHDFVMDAITINGIRLSLNMTVNTDEFTEQITQLSDAIQALDDGAGDLLSGLEALQKGMTEYVSGLKDFRDGLSALESGTEQLQEGAEGLHDGLNQLSGQSAALVSGAHAMEQAAFNSANTQLSALYPTLPVLTRDNYAALLDTISQLAPLKAQLDGAVQFTDGVIAYTQGVAQLTNGAAELADGTAQLHSSAGTIADSAGSLYDAAAELNSAIKQLRDGLAAYKDGTGELADGTKDINGEIDTQIDEMLSGLTGSGDPIISFVSGKNTNVTAVQFVCRTTAIEAPAEAAPAEETPVQLTFWQRLLKLFGLYDG